MFFKDCLGVVGWDSIEPTVLIALAEDVRVCFVGNHGSSKTSVCQRLAMALHNVEVKFQRYDTPNVKHDEIFGITNVKALTEGRYEFVKHPQSVWGKEVILWSEINRPNPMMQSKLNELLLEGTLHGAPTKVKWQFADANPSAKYEAYYLQPQLAARLFFIDVPNPNVTMLAEMLSNTDKYDVFQEVTCSDPEERKQLVKERNNKIKKQVGPLGIFFQELVHAKITDADRKFALEVTTSAMRAMNSDQNGETFQLSLREGKRMFNMLARACAYIRLAKIDPASMLGIAEQIVVGHIPHAHGMLAKSYDWASVVGDVRVTVTKTLDSNPTVALMNNTDPINIIIAMRRDLRAGPLEVDHLKSSLAGHTPDDHIRYLRFLSKRAVHPDKALDVVERVARVIANSAALSWPNLNFDSKICWSDVDSVTRNTVDTFKLNNGL